jgi:hypothetical protein
MPVAAAILSQDRTGNIEKTVLAGIGPSIMVGLMTTVAFVPRLYTSGTKIKSKGMREGYVIRR